MARRSRRARVWRDSAPWWRRRPAPGGSSTRCGVPGARVLVLGHTGGARSWPRSPPTPGGRRFLEAGDRHLRWSRLVGQPEVFRCLSTHPSLSKTGGGNRGWGSGGGGRGGSILCILWITPRTGSRTRSPSDLGTRNCHLLPMSVTLPPVRAPRHRGRPRTASGHRVPSAVARRCRTRSTRRSPAAPRSRPPTRAGRPPRTSASATAAR